MSTPKALGARLSSLHAAAFLTHGFYLPFFPLWLQSKALTPTMIGVIVAVPIIIRVLVTAPLLTLPDKGVSARNLLIAFYLGQIVGYGLLMFAEDGLVIMGLVAGLSVAQAAVIPANDLVTTVEVQRHQHLNYGRIRSAGSIAFFCANILGGYLIGLYGVRIVVWALALIPAVGIAATWMALPRQDSMRRSNAPLLNSEAKPKLSAVLYIVMMAAALIQGSHGGLNAFASIYWQSAHFSDAVIGYFWAVGVVAEILVFFFLGRFVGRGSDGLMLILVGAAASVLRFTILALHPGLAVTFVVQALHGLTFGATHLGTMAALTALAPAQARGRAQGLFGSVAALIMFGSTVLSGFVYNQAGAMVFAAMVPFGAAGLVLTLVAIRMVRA
jgi:MFS transporter, PPP family, 3-phenylpropionic acid transporter